MQELDVKDGTSHFPVHYGSLTDGEEDMQEI